MAILLHGCGDYRYIGSTLDELQALVAFESVTPGSLPPSSSSRAGCPLPAPVLSVRCGASRRPAGGIQRWPAAGAGRAGQPRARASAGRVAAGWHGVGGRSRWKRPFDFPIPRQVAALALAIGIMRATI